MVASIFIELSVIIIIAVIVTALMRILRQPVIIGYIIVGILASPYLFNVIKSTEIITTLSEIGIAILLFMVGLNLNPKVIKDVGKVSLVTGVGQFLFTAVVGYGIARWLGFSFLPALYLSIAITFSSTIIITKLLSDKGDLHKLYGKISIGFLIVQDFLAVIALMMVSSLISGNSFEIFSIRTFLMGLAAIVVLFVLSYFSLPRITKLIARSSEFLLLFSLGWCFLIATIFEALSLSIEMGAFLGGVTLSLSPYRYEINSKLKPIRDFFIFLFFVWLGAQIVFSDVRMHIPTIVILSLLVLIGNPLIIMTLMGILKYKKQTGFLVGLAGAQISEFSHILIALGIKVGHLQSDMLSLVTMIGLVTIAGSTYFITHGEKIYFMISRYLPIFERKSAVEKKDKEKKYDIILFGAHRIGHDILEEFKNRKSSLLVVDYNPDVIERLSKKGFNCIYGDISDVDLFDDINLCDAKIIIQT